MQLIHLPYFIKHPEKNSAKMQLLSKLRAVNTLQAIRDIMGDRLGIPQDQQEAEGLCEMPSYMGIRTELIAVGEKLPSNEEIKEYVASHRHKVEVSIGSQVLLTLHGAAVNANEG